jgi:hypothetical protein
MIVSGAEGVSLHEARFNAAECFPATLLGEPVIGSADSGHSILAVTFHQGPDGVIIDTGELSKIDRLPEQALIVILDASGRVLAAGPVGEWTSTEFGHGLTGSCGAPGDSKPGLV